MVISVKGVQTIHVGILAERIILAILRHEPISIINRLNETLPLKPGAIIHTGLLRTIETTKTINRNLNVPLIGCSGLKEQFFGDWQGLPWADIYPQIKAIGINPPHGERQTDFIDRILNGLQKVLVAYSAPLLLVMHGGVFEALGLHYILR